MTRPPAHSKQLGDMLVEVLEDWDNAETRTLGALTGFHDLDDTVGGLPLGGITVLAARPAMGKTTLALNIARNVAFRGGRTLYCSLVDNEHAMTESILSSTARLDRMRFRSTGVQADWTRALRGAGRLYGLPLHLISDRSLTVGDVRSEAEHLHADNADLELLVVDWAQLLPDFEESVADLARLAAELQIAVLVVSQLDRQLEERANKRPRLGDLLGPPVLEQRADLVLMLYRPEYYDPDVPELLGVAELSIVKNRSGPLKVFPLAFLPEYRLFADLGRLFD